MRRNLFFLLLEEMFQAKCNPVFVQCGLMLSINLSARLPALSFVFYSWMSMLVVYGRYCRQGRQITSSVPICTSSQLRWLSSLRELSNVITSVSVFTLTISTFVPVYFDCQCFCVYADFTDIITNIAVTFPFPCF